MEEEQPELSLDRSVSSKPSKMRVSNTDKSRCYDDDDDDDDDDAVCLPTAYIRFCQEA